MTKSEKNAIARGCYRYSANCRQIQCALRPILEGLTSRLRRGRRCVKRDAVAFGIDDHGAKTVLADFLARAQDLSAIGTGGFYGLIQASVYQKINQRPICRRPIVHAAAVAPNTQATGRILFPVWQKSVFHSAF
jgi:hypothetical protein